MSVLTHVAVWKHRRTDGQRVWPPELRDFVGIVTHVDPEGMNEGLINVIANRFGAGEFTCMPDPPTPEKLRAMKWGSGGLSVRTVEPPTPDHLPPEIVATPS